MMVATLGIALPEVRQTFSLSEIAAGSLFSVMMIVAAVTSGIAGRLADRFGPKTVLITGLTLLALGFGGAGISGQRILFFSCLAVTGIGYGFTPPSQYAIMSDLLPHRRGYDLDYDRLFATSVETGTLLEVDGAPAHLDMHGVLARRAITAGVTLAISSDCHRAEYLDRQMNLGVTTARRGWVEARHVVNTRPIAEVRAFIAAKRAR